MNYILFQNTQEGMTKSSQEVISLREAKRELEATVRELRSQLEVCQAQLERSQQDSKILNEQVGGSASVGNNWLKVLSVVCYWAATFL